MFVASNADTSIWRRPLASERPLCVFVLWKCLQRLLRFNIGKCCTLHYGHNNANHTYIIYIDENGVQKELVNSNSVKDLGITFDTDMKFRKHISGCINKANRISGLLRRSFLQSY